MSVLALFAHKRHAGGGGQRHADIQSNARVEGLGAALGVGGLGVGGGLVVVTRRGVGDAAPLQGKTNWACHPTLQAPQGEGLWLLFSINLLTL